MNLGQPLFILLTVIALFSTLGHGLPPIGIAETLLWASLSALWTKKNWKDVRLNYVLLAITALILLGEGYRVGLMAGQREMTKVALSRFDDTPKPKPESTNNSSSNSVAEKEQQIISDIMALTPDKLISRCGKPLADRTTKNAENTEFRDLSYTDVYGGTISLVFSGPYDIFLGVPTSKGWDPIISLRLNIYSEKYAFEAAALLPCAADKGIKTE